MPTVAMWPLEESRGVMWAEETPCPPPKKSLALALLEQICVTLPQMSFFAMINMDTADALGLAKNK